MKRWLVLGVFTLLIVAGLGWLVWQQSDIQTPTSKTILKAGGSGLEGVATLGPTAPVCRVNQECTAAYSGWFIVRKATSADPNGSLGDQVARFQSDEKGRFKVAVAPGSYVVTKEGLGRPFLKPQLTTVESGRYTSVELRVDSGIR